ncbi:uncharacterized protein TNCV_819611 [Trichonephila clavipes]|nr:uncharacterized protein TNCV_819611 [Trichonephila clavipes]
MSDNQCGGRISWTYSYAVMVPWINTIVQFPSARHHSKRRRRQVGVNDSTRPSARRLRMVQEDSGAPSEGATCAWMAANEAVGCTCAFLTMWRSSQQLVCRGRP